MIQYDLTTLDQDAVLVCGSFTIDAAGAVSLADIFGGSVAYSGGAGEWVLTFQDSWGRMLSGGMTFQKTAAADAMAQLGEYDASAKTLDLHLWDFSGAALANVAGRIHFWAIMSNRRV